MKNTEADNKCIADLVKQIQAGDDNIALQSLFYEFKPFIHSVMSQYKISPNAYDDVCNVVMYMLFTKAKSYAPNSGCSINQHFYRQIRSEIIDYIRANPVSDFSKTKSIANKVHKAYQQCALLGINNPTTEEIAEYGNINYEKLTAYLSSIQRIYLDEKNPQNREICELVPDPKSRDPEEEFILSENSEEVERFLDAHLESRHATMVKLTILKGVTLKEVGERFGVTESRVSRLVTKGLKKVQPFLKQQGETSKF